MSFIFSSSPQALWLYQYDSDGSYIGSVFMQIPANTGLPANTTHLPCQPRHGQTGIFNGAVWEYVTDVRGTQYWNAYGQGFVISSLADTIPDWAISIAPPVAEPGCVLLFTEGKWQQVKDKTGQAYYEINGNKHIVPDAYFTLPDNCTFIAPPEPKPTFVTQWNGSEWTYVKDLRGQRAYSTETKELSTVMDIGPLPDGYTLLVPGRFDVWNGNAWVKDEVAEQAFNADQAERQKAALMGMATEQIAVLNFAIDRGVATDSEISKLTQWEEYRLELNRIDTNAINITWPERP